MLQCLVSTIHGGCELTHKRDSLRRAKKSDEALRRTDVEIKHLKPSTRVEVEQDRDNMLATRAINKLKELGLWEKAEQVEEGQSSQI